MTRFKLRPQAWPCYHCGAYNRHVHARPYRPRRSRRRAPAPFAAEVLLLAFIGVVMVWLMWRSPELLGPGSWWPSN